uniref:DUF2292 domain-containing protein n=1 Tax=uncultured Armatimonadetes bacterium TaxID=157466 RepID=A0A6J4ILK8_9BACT|nr:hypothetical protein AVDCRST_MAG63-2169 [uncultured Armatimonadetes bacterium]
MFEGIATGTPSPTVDSHAWALDRIQEALRGLRFGEVTVIVQDGVVVQVERTDKVRLPRDDRRR